MPIAIERVRPSIVSSRLSGRGRGAGTTIPHAAARGHALDWIVGRVCRRVRCRFARFGRRISNRGQHEPGAAPRTLGRNRTANKRLQPQPAPASQPPSTLPPVASESPAATSSAALATATTGRIQVRSTPSNAGVTVNGRWRGRTPLSVDKLPFGQYSVRIVQPGYVVAREDFALTGADASRTLSVRLAAADTRGSCRTGATRAAAIPAAGSPRPAPSTPRRAEAYTGSIYVDSRPRGARVFVDGRAVGTTPVRIPDVAIGSHVVRLELSDHRSWSAIDERDRGSRNGVTGSLERIQ